MKINNIEVKLFKSFGNYGISECGKVFNMRTGRQLKLCKRKNTRYQSIHVELSDNGEKKVFSVHRLVAETWLPPPETDRHNNVNHIDGNPSNNHASNLEWVTPAQNVNHALSTGLKRKGGDVPSALLTEEQAHEVCKALVDGARNIDLAIKYGVAAVTISNIRSGNTHQAVRALYDIPCAYKNDLSESTVKWICNKIIEGYSDTAIEKLSNNKKVTWRTVGQIRHKIRYKLISDMYF